MYVNLCTMERLHSNRWSQIRDNVTKQITAKQLWMTIWYSLIWLESVSLKLWSYKEKKSHFRNDSTIHKKFQGYDCLLISITRAIQCNIEFFSTLPKLHSGRCLWHKQWSKKRPYSLRVNQASMINLHLQILGFENPCRASFQEFEGFDEVQFVNSKCWGTLPYIIKVF